MATQELPQIVAELRQLYPGIKIELIPTHEASDLKRREADVAIRGYRPDQEDLIARKLRSELGRLYATPEYLASIGNPSKLSDLSCAAFIGFDRSPGFITFVNELGLNLTEDQFVVFANDLVVHWELVKQGIGIGAMVEGVGEAEPKVRCVLPELPPFSGELWLVTHSELRTNRRVRVVFDFLAEKLSRPSPPG